MDLLLTPGSGEDRIEGTVKHSNLVALLPTMRITVKRRD